MRKATALTLSLVFTVCILGCAKKQETQERLEPISMEVLTTLNTTANTSPDVTKPEVTPPELKPLPPSGPYKPTAKDIQSALKNANYYSGEIDGKIGPQTRKAVEGFQKANGLDVDGKVGLKTWEALKKYLNPSP